MAYLSECFFGIYSQFAGARPKILLHKDIFMWQSIRRKLIAVAVPLVAVPVIALFMADPASGKAAVSVLLIISIVSPPAILWLLQRVAVVSAKSIKTDSGIETNPGTEVSPNFGNWQGSLKRIIDILVSAVITVAALPVFLLVCLAIKLEDGGPIFYTLSCLGRHRRPFTLVKFRTLEVGFDLEGSITRVRPPSTRVGAFLERFMLGKLPMLLNVLKGEISLIGPQPQPRRDSYPRTGWATVLLEVRPGVVSLAGVMADARQKALIREHQILWDIFYINHWSLTMDAKISWWLIKSALLGRGDPPKADSLRATQDNAVGEPLPAV